MAAPRLQRLETTADGIARVLMTAAAFWTFALAAVILADVVGRAFDRPFTGAKEIVANSIVIVVFMQLAYAVTSGAMLRADFLQVGLGARAGALVAALGYLLGAALFALVALGCVEPLAHAWRAGEYEGEGALKVPTWPTYVAIIAGSLLGGCAYLLRAARRLADLRG